jgi:hypothetical protein
MESKKGNFITFPFFFFLLLLAVALSLCVCALCRNTVDTYDPRTFHKESEAVTYHCEELNARGEGAVREKERRRPLGRRFLRKRREGRRECVEVSHRHSVSDEEKRKERKKRRRRTKKI